MVKSIIFVIATFLASLDPALTETDPCYLPPESGPCYALIPKFYYDPIAEDCYSFTYGGCGGNGNKFETKAECLEKCYCYRK